MTSLVALTNRTLAFRDARDWQQFHSLKNLLISLNIEAAELLELAQWKEEAELIKELDTGDLKSRIAEECSDVLIYLLLISAHAGVDIIEATEAKVTRNEEKYPVSKARGSAKKYTEF